MRNGFRLKPIPVHNGSGSYWFRSKTSSGSYRFRSKTSSGSYQGPLGPWAQWAIFPHPLVKVLFFTCSPSSSSSSLLLPPPSSPSSWEHLPRRWTLVPPNTLHPGNITPAAGRLYLPLPRTLETSPPLLDACTSDSRVTWKHHLRCWTPVPPTPRHPGSRNTRWGC